MWVILGIYFGLSLFLLIELARKGTFKKQAKFLKEQGKGPIKTFLYIFYYGVLFTIFIGPIYAIQGAVEEIKKINREGRGRYE